MQPASHSDARRITWKSLLFAQPGRQLGTRADVELLVDPRQGGLDRVHRNHEDLGDLLVLLPLGNQVGDAALARRELSGCLRPSTDALELRLSALRPEAR